MFPHIPLDPPLRYESFCSVSKLRHKDAAKKFGFSNIITREVAPSREISRPPNNLFL